MAKRELLLLLIIFFHIVVTKNYSGIKAIGSPFARDAMIGRQEVKCSLLLVVPTFPGKDANEAYDNKTRRCKKPFIVFLNFVHCALKPILVLSVC